MKNEIYVTFNLHDGGWVAVGKINSMLKLNQLKKLVAGTTMPDDYCINSFMMTHEHTMSFMQPGGYTKKHMTYTSQMLYIKELFEPDCTTPCKCDNKCNDEFGRLNTCARNLRAGKCRDEFMRVTLGAILFPKLYGKDKQK